MSVAPKASQEEASTGGKKSWKGHLRGDLASVPTPCKVTER